jgi:hypothetical protein
VNNKWHTQWHTEMKKAPQGAYSLGLWRKR